MYFDITMQVYKKGRRNLIFLVTLVRAWRLLARDQNLYGFGNEHNSAQMSDHKSHFSTPGKVLENCLPAQRA